MIGKLISTATVLVVGGVITYTGLAYHIVSTGDGRVWVPKAELGLSDTFVDISDWTASDFIDNTKITSALVENGHAGLVAKQGSGLSDWLKGDDADDNDAEK